MSVNQNFPEVSPSLLLDFANSRTLDPRITFTRSSVGTYVASNGLIKTAAADEARFDHDPETGESLGLLIEGSRTNLLTYSEEFDQWIVAGNSLISPNSIVAPDGSLTADQIYFNTVGATNVGQNVTLTQNQTYTFSVYAKAVTPGSDNQFVPYIASPTALYPATFVATSEWQRFTFTFTHTGATASIPVYILNKDDTYKTNVYFWGAQLEVGSFPTSYIPTSGSQVTRQPDNAQITGSNLLNFINKNEYTLVCSIKHRQFIGGSYPSIGFGGGSVDNWQQLRFYRSDGGNPRADFNGSNSGDFFATGVVNLASGSTNQTTPIYNLNEDMLYAFSINSTSAQIDLKQDGFAHQTRSVTFSEKNWFTPNLFAIHFAPTYEISASSPLNGTIKYIKYYPERLTDTQLQSLTK